MIISIIAAMAENRVIGRDGKLPWHLPDDLARFKAITMGHPVVMGRKTFESIGRPLPGRTTIVLSRTLTELEGCRLARSLEEAVALGRGAEELFVCGGEEVFREALPLAQRIYLTVVQGEYPGEVRFPELPPEFLRIHAEEADTSPPSRFLVFEKVAPGADAAEFYRKGEQALARELYYLARSCFHQAAQLQESPEISSQLAYSIAKSGGELTEALRLAQKALERAPETPLVYLNLGRIQIMAGVKQSGLETLRKGVQKGGGPEILAELERHGTRLPPPLGWLPRSHPLNRYLGLILARVGAR